MATPPGANSGTSMAFASHPRRATTCRPEQLESDCHLPAHTGFAAAPNSLSTKLVTRSVICGGRRPVEHDTRGDAAGTGLRLRCRRHRRHGQRQAVSAPLAPGHSRNTWRSESPLAADPGVHRLRRRDDAAAPASSRRTRESRSSPSGLFSTSEVPMSAVTWNDPSGVTRPTVAMVAPTAPSADARRLGWPPNPIVTIQVALSPGTRCHVAPSQTRRWNRQATAGHRQPPPWCRAQGRAARWRPSVRSNVVRWGPRDSVHFPRHQPRRA